MSDGCVETQNKRCTKSRAYQSSNRMERQCKNRILMLNQCDTAKQPRHTMTSRKVPIYEPMEPSAFTKSKQHSNAISRLASEIRNLHHKKQSILNRDDQTHSIASHENPRIIIEVDPPYFVSGHSMNKSAHPQRCIITSPVTSPGLESFTNRRDPSFRKNRDHNDHKHKDKDITNQRIYESNRNDSNPYHTKVIAADETLDDRIRRIMSEQLDQLKIDFKQISADSIQNNKIGLNSVDIAIQTMKPEDDDSRFQPLTNSVLQIQDHVSGMESGAREKTTPTNGYEYDCIDKEERDQSNRVSVQLEDKRMLVGNMIIEYEDIQGIMALDDCWLELHTNEGRVQLKAPSSLTRNTWRDSIIRKCEQFGREQ